MFGIALVSVVVAVGCAYLAKQCLRRPGRFAVVQHWLAFGLYLLSGMAWAVVALPVTGWITWTWLIVAVAFVCLGLVVGTLFDVAADRKPDRPAFWAARVVPVLLLLTVWHWGTFTSTVGDQVDVYQSNLISTR